MEHFLRIAALLALLVCPSLANAATCFWIGGTATWDTSNTASWASTSGGSASTCAATGSIPKQAADTAVFDASSGAGTVTLGSSLNGITLTGITFTAASVSVDFSANNPSITFTGVFVQSGVSQTINCGTGTLTFTGANASMWNISGTVTLTCASGTIAFTYSGALNGTQTFAGGGKTYGTLTLNGATTATPMSITGANTFATVNINGPAIVSWPGGATNTITNSFNWAGTSANPIRLSGASGAVSTIVASAVSTISWAYISTLTFTTSAVTATNSLDGRSNTGVTINAPVTGGGRGIIGG